MEKRPRQRWVFCAVFMELSKIFDTTNHDLLIAKGALMQI